MHSDSQQDNNEHGCDACCCISREAFREGRTTVLASRKGRSMREERTLAACHSRFVESSGGIIKTVGQPARDLYPSAVQGGMTSYRRKSVRRAKNHMEMGCEDLGCRPF